MANAIEIASLFATLSLHNTLSGSLRTAGRDLDGFQGRLQRVGQGARRFGAQMLSGLTLPVLAVGAAAVNAAMDWESAFAGVRKTVEGSAEELNLLEQQLRDLATGATGSPVAALEGAHEELARIAELGGSLGIATENIADFTEIVGMLAMTTDMSADSAATMFAQFANITGMDMSDLDRAGSTLVDLGNKMAATEGQIMEFAVRLAAAGTQFGLSEKEIMALGATMASLGMEPEAGGTAMTQTLNKMTEAAARGGPLLDAFARAAGTTAEGFADLVNNDPSGALMAFIEGFSKMDAAGQLATLDQLGLSGIRTSDALRRLAADPALLASALDIANAAWEENTALMDEATKRAETAQGMMNELGNAVKDLLITAGNNLLPIFTDLIEGFTLLTRGDFAGGVAKIGEAIQGAADAVGNLIKGLADSVLVGMENLFHIELPNVDETLAIWQGIADNVGIILTTLRDQVTAGMSALWANIEPLVLPVIDFFALTLPEAIGTFVTTVSTLWDNIRSGIEAVRDGILAFLQPVLDLINNISSALSNIVPSNPTTAGIAAGLGGGGTRAADFGPPGRADGVGYVPQTGPRMLHEGEVVMNRRQQRQYGRSMGGGGNTINAYGTNPYDLVRLIDKAQRNMGY